MHGLSVAVVALLLGAFSALAAPVSFRNAHPVAWMHLLPVGEQPGWTKRGWVSIELNHANVWNNEFTMTDKRTGDIYTYEADFEQSSAILNLGLALSSTLALGLELPYANRNGGFLDDFIDQFHQTIRTDRFLRHLNDPFGNSFIVRKNGEDRLTTVHGEGLGSHKLKFKWWPLQWRSPTPGLCDCGVGFSAQVKFPTQRRTTGLSSGEKDYSGLAHIGLPLGKYSAAWATAAFTKLGGNENLNGWPRREWLQMYELSLDIGFGSSFGLILQARTESPLLMREHLSYNYTYITEAGQLAERVASGWNSLVEWRGSQSLGLRWLWKSGSSANFMLVEDWGLGSRGLPSEWNYVNNAPDIAFISQWHFTL